MRRTLLSILPEFVPNVFPAVVARESVFPRFPDVAFGATNLVGTLEHGLGISLREKEKMQSESELIVYCETV
jgi:hypothetical protein